MHKFLENVIKYLKWVNSRDVDQKDVTKGRSYVHKRRIPINYNKYIRSSILLHIFDENVKLILHKFVS